jgi:hypothetical protein
MVSGAQFQNDIEAVFGESRDSIIRLFNESNNLANIFPNIRGDHPPVGGGPIGENARTLLSIMGDIIHIVETIFVPSIDEINMRYFDLIMKVNGDDLPRLSWKISGLIRVLNADQHHPHPYEVGVLTQTNQNIANVNHTLADVVDHPLKRIYDYMHSQPLTQLVGDNPI